MIRTVATIAVFFQWGPSRTVVSGFADGWFGLFWNRTALSASSRVAAPMNPSMFSSFLPIQITGRYMAVFRKVGVYVMSFIVVSCVGGFGCSVPGPRSAIGQILIGEE